MSAPRALGSAGAAARETGAAAPVVPRSHNHASLCCAIGHDPVPGVTDPKGRFRRVGTTGRRVVARGVSRAS